MTLEDSLKKLQSLQSRPDGMTSREWTEIKKNLGELVKRRDSNFNPAKHKAETQSSLARIFIRWYFWILIAILLYVPAYNWLAVKFFMSPANPDPSQLLGVKDAFIMVSSAVGPMLAFVLGHYFKGKD